MASNTPAEHAAVPETPLWKQPTVLKGALLTLRLLQVIVSFIILVPAGMAADAARKTQAVVNSIQEALGVNIPRNPRPASSTGGSGAPAPGGSAAPAPGGSAAPGMPNIGINDPQWNAAYQQSLQAATQWATQLSQQLGTTVGGSGRKLLAAPIFWGNAKDALALYIIVMLFGLLTLFLSAVWLLYAVRPARRPAAPRWAAAKCWATSGVIWELIWDGVLAAFWLAITIAAGALGIMTMEGACSVLAAVLFVLFALSWAGTFVLAKLTAGPAPPPAAVADGTAPAPAEGKKKKGGKKGEEEKKEGDVEAPAVEGGKKPSPAVAEEGSGVTGKIELVTSEGVKVEETKK